ncbi:MAG TPA: DEAD/DEAH box helicase, partial [Sphingomicrobium sp.]
MATSPEAIAQLIAEATAAGFRGDLLAKGQARAMVWRDGVVPPAAPQFSTLLTYDLLSYAYSLLNQGLRLLDQQAEFGAARTVFEHAASAIEAATARGRVTNDRDFHQLVAGACYHLARYAARAFSLLHEGLNEANLSVPERAVALLMLRDLATLETLIGEERRTASEDAMIAYLAGGGAGDAPASVDSDDEPKDEPLLQVVDRALADNFMAALAIALLAFERGDGALIGSAIERLKIGLRFDSSGWSIAAQWTPRLPIPGNIIAAPLGGGVDFSWKLTGVGDHAR